MSDEEASWQKEFERVGPDTLRLRLETRRPEISPEYARSAEKWLAKEKAKSEACDRTRFRSILFWTIVAAIASLIAASPIVWSWFSRYFGG